jgi:hypothetical protein
VRDYSVDIWYGCDDVDLVGRDLETGGESACMHILYGVWSVNICL